LFELKRLSEAAGAAGLASKILVDLGETRDFAYYTGALFQIHAEGPGRALGAGGRYDGLLERFGAARPAVGFAFGLDDVAWALEHAGRVRELPPKLLLAANAGSLVEQLRSAGLAAAPAPGGDPLAYARAWRYSHVLEAGPSGLCLLHVASSHREAVTAAPAELGSWLSARLAPGASGKDISCRP
jgi:ATP phosphoribosyltransferase regulatory subunit